MNAIKTTLLLGLLSGLLLLGGQALGGQQGMTIGLVIAIGMNFFSYFFSEKMALMSSGAQRVSETEHPDIWRRIGPMTQALTQKMGLPMPRLWVTPEQTPNAFATGRNPNHSSVAVTYGLVQLMDDQELAGVIAHELGHIKNRDILISSIAATIGTAITYTAHMAMFFGGRRSDDDEGGSSPIVALLMVFLAPVAAGVIQMAISRTREFSADEASARATGNREWLFRALSKLDSYGRQLPMDPSPSTAHMYIMKSFGGGGIMKLFSTHPPTEARIAHLRSLAL
jgi:heat shock protein HtpX